MNPSYRDLNPLAYDPFAYEETQTMPNNRRTELTRQLEMMLRQAERIEKELSELDNMPQDNFEAGTVLRIIKNYPSSPGVDYTFVYIKWGQKWYSSGNGVYRSSWDRLVEFHGVDNVLKAQKASTWKKAF